MKVVINTCFGGFSLSPEAINLYEQKSGKQEVDQYDISRTDPYLVEVVEELKEKANGYYAELKIVEIPDQPNLKWNILDFDGVEAIHEDHRIWR